MVRQQVVALGILCLLSVSDYSNYMATYRPGGANMLRQLLKLQWPFTPRRIGLGPKGNLVPRDGWRVAFANLWDSINPERGYAWPQNLLG